MNAMRRLLSGSSAPGGQTGSGGSQDQPDGEYRLPSSQSQHAALSLMHLRKLFGDYSSVCHSLLDEERDEKLYSMLPLFCRVFGSTTSSEMSEKFPEMTVFAQAVSKLMVSETRKRAANQSTAEASFAISRFLEIDSSEELSNGWMLLTAVNLLTAAGQPMMEVMAAASVPSTLVKCLYLFFDLPEIQNGDVIEPGNDFSPKETRVLLQKVFSQILVKLCNYPVAVEELAKEDDLQLLFGALTSWCPTFNAPWRKVASETLLTITRHCLTPSVLGYIHNKGCISLCVENMQRTQLELSPLELVEMFVTVFCLLKDSAEFTPCLLDDFRSTHGYTFLVEFLLSAENDSTPEAQEAVRNLVLLVASLATCGFSEIRPSPGAGAGSIFQMPGFAVPQPAGRGGSIRNIQAFQVLQTVFLRATTPALCSIVLDAISNLYHSDDANYFILEAETTLPRFAEIIHTKPTEIQEKFFKLHEFLVFQLNYIPCRELISLSLIIRNQNSLPCSVLCTVALLSYLRFNSVFKDVYREVGLLEVFMICLQRFGNMFAEKTSAATEGKDLKLTDQQEKLVFVAMEVMCVLLNGNVKNAEVFRTCGGTKCVQDLVLQTEVRREALGILQQLVLTTGAEEDMGALLGLLQNSNLIEVKIDVMKSILSVLRESHRTRTVFRRVSGFVYLMSILVSMDGSLSEPPLPSPWDATSRKDILRLLHLTFNTLAIALRFEPANAKYFHHEICKTNLCDSLRLLGCFSREKILTSGVQNFLPTEEASFHSIFYGGVLDEDEEGFEKVPVSLRNSCLVFRMLFDLAVDAYDRGTPGVCLRNSRTQSMESANVRTSSSDGRGQLSLLPISGSPIIAHPGVVLTMFQLIPSIFHESDLQMSATLQTFVFERLKNLLKTERNLQVMCDAFLANYCITVGELGLLDESHLLHGPLMQLLERLASHSLEPKDLRTFLRLGGPLKSVSPELPKRDDFAYYQSVKYSGQPVPLSRIKTLVAMATPQGLTSVVAPPFVEFEMSSEGFGALFIPSLAPQSAGSPGVVGMSALGVTGDMSVNGGIGMGDRCFPPPTGLTYSSWVYVEKYPDPRTEPHPVRLLTVVRSVTGKEEQYICLALALSARDRALIVSTHETPLSKATGDWEPDVTGDGAVRIWNPELVQEGQWHHMTFVFNKSVLKHSQFSLYINGQHIHTCKLQYMCQNPGGAPGNLVMTKSVNAFVGTAPCWRKVSRTAWRQGPCHLIEDVWSPQTVEKAYSLGPRYLGCFQAPEMPGHSDPLGYLVPEERIIFSINAGATSSLTLAKIKKVFNKTDSKAIAKQLGMSTNENATPIFILHNAAGHLAGAARSLGGVVIGYMGARIFNPKPVSTVIQAVGGTSVLLGLTAMARDTESLYAAVKALVCVIRAEPSVDREMERTAGYQTLATLLRRHKLLLNNHILQLIFSLVGTINSGRETLIIPSNITAFRDMLCDLEVWRDTNGDLLRSLLDHFHELLAESSEKKNNLKALRELNMVARLLYLLKESHLALSTTQAALSVLRLLLAVNPRPVDLLCFGQFVASTLPSSLASEKSVKIRDALDRRENSLLPADLQPSHRDTEDPLLNSQSSQILLRNRCLKVLLQLVTGNRLQQSFCDELLRVLGFDWVLMFMQGHVHPSSVTISLRILTVMVSQPVYLQRFREGGSTSGWVRQTELIMQNRLGSVLGFQIGSALSKVGGSSQSTEESTPHIPGFTALQNMLPKHFDVPEVYFLLIAMLLGQPGQNLPAVPQLDLDLDTIWSCVFGVTPGQNTNVSLSSMLSKGLVCSEAMICLLGMLRMMMNCDGNHSESIPAWLQNYPVTLVQFLFYLYHNAPDALSVFLSGELISALESTVFPPNLSEPPSEPMSPLDDLKNLDASSVFPTTDMPLGDGNGSCLSNHPAKKFVMDFLKNLVVDSLSLSQPNKTTPVIDLLLEGAPEGSSHAQQCKFQTEVLTLLMDHLVAADILIGEQAALPVVVGGSIHHIASNVIYLTGRLVDKLWLGYFQKDPHEVFDFIIKLIAQSKRRSSSSTLSLDHLYRCLNRTILFLLSRPIDCTVDQTSMLSALHKLTHNRMLIFGAGNHDLEFVGSVTYCLVNLVTGQRIPSDTGYSSTWHVVSNIADDQETNANFVHGQNLIILAARRVWDEMYITKKPAIEEAFKVTLSTSNTTPSLEQIKDIVYESGHKLWLSYVDSEKKGTANKTTPVWELHTQFQSKLQKVTGGLTRLGSRTKAMVVSTAGLKREDSLAVRPRNSSLSGSGQNVTLTFPEWQAALIGHVGVIKEQVKTQIQQYEQAYQHVQKYIVDEWQATEKELLRERGLWGPDVPSKFEKWMLDVSEGPCRMRKKLIRNELFYHHYPYRPEIEVGDRQAKYKVAMSLDSKAHHQLYSTQCKSLLFDQNVALVKEKLNAEWNAVGQENLVADPCWVGATATEVKPLRENSSEIFEERNDLGLSELPSLLKNSGGRATAELEEDFEGLEIDIGVDASANAVTDLVSEQCSAYQTLLALLDEGEKISHMFRCARIQGLDTVEGLLLFGKEHCYVVDGYTLLRSREVMDIQSLPPGLHEPIIPPSSAITTNSTLQFAQRQCSKLAYVDIKEVHIRKYLLQPNGVEVFSTDGRNYLLAFPRHMRNKVYQRFLAVATSISDNAQQSVAGQKRTASVEQSSGLLSSFMGETSVTQRWVRGEISNFQYLMHLNTLAGRSYNDLMQYPVFPWVLADYDSAELDLTDPATFRDLSKPMGAQTPDRLEQFKKRYKEWEDPHLETPPYHYGTHYSSAMIVCSYLIRLEPFAQHFLNLQGGHFDLADRMFHSIREAWYSAAKHNMADIKELIPEFFYLPDFLVNSNHFDLGTKQSGVQLDDIVLPPWAKNDPREFIRVHRQALECDYVSAHLHEWIDLIFGYKQQGPAAVEAVNVFHHLFYEGSVDIYSIDDPLKRNAIIGFINNFGQTPKPLFKKPHPAKKVGKGTFPSDFSQVSISMGSAASEKLFFHHLHTLRPSLQPVKELKRPVGQIVQQDRALLAVEENKVFMPPSNTRCVSWGYADHTIRISTYENERTILVCESQQYGDILTCVCPTPKIIISGGSDTVVTVWEIGRRTLEVKKRLFGHTDVVTCLAARQSYQIIVSGSRDGTAIIWDLSRLTFVRQLQGHQGPVTAVSINDLTGDIATCAGTWLYLWSVNGELIASVNTLVGKADRMQQILCVTFSQALEWDPRNVILTGSTDGVVRMWCLEYVQVPIDEQPSVVTEEKGFGKESLIEKHEPKDESEQESSDDENDSTELHKRLQSIIAENQELLTELRDPKVTGKGHLERQSSVDEPIRSSDMDVFYQSVYDQNVDGTFDMESFEDFDSRSGSFDVKEDAAGRSLSVERIEKQATRQRRLSPSSRANLCKSVGNMMSLRDEFSDDSDDEMREKAKPLKSSKSVSSLGESFVVVDGSSGLESVASAESKSGKQKTETLGKKEQKNALREGFKWQRQLVFSSKLTMHTAFDRPDNAFPASITALQVSRDHRSVYVGDARGRIYSWSVADLPGKSMADYWLKDEGAESCRACTTRFTLTERKHHCRNCGHVFCSKCSRFESEITRLRIRRPVRVCQTCYQILRQSNES